MAYIIYRDYIGVMLYRVFCSKKPHVLSMPFLDP